MLLFKSKVADILSVAFSLDFAFGNQLAERTFDRTDA
jgi:hypothetical protein